MGLLARLRRKLWSESDSARRFRRLRQLVTVPPMMLAGAVWGILAGVGSAMETSILASGLIGALGFGVGSWLYLHLQPLVLWWAEDRAPRFGRWLGAGLDTLMAGSVVWLLTDVLAFPTFPQVTSIVALGGAYAAVIAGFFDEGGSRLIGGALGILRGGGTGIPNVPYSHIESMRQRGMFDDARAALETFVAEHPRDPRGWLDLGRLLADHFGEVEEATWAIRTGIDRARLDLPARRHYVATLLRIRRVRGEQHLVGRDLALLSEVAGDSPQGEWARRELAELRAESTTLPSVLDAADDPEGDQEYENRQK